MTTSPLLDVLEEVITTTVTPGASIVDAEGAFPRAQVTALGRAGLLGLVSSTEVGGAGGTLADAAHVVRRLAASCGSTAMVVCMHYCATAALEVHGARPLRQDIAAGAHLSTLAFSEVGSRSQFWAPLSTARGDGGEIVLDARKTWVTSAGEAQSYVWISRPVDAASGATLWLVPSDSTGLQVRGPFDGLGLRGNASNPIDADGLRVPLANRLGEDGAGLDLALGVVLPVFQILSAAASLGMMDSAVERAIDHVTSTRLEHLDQTLARQPVVRQHVAQMRNRADQAASLVGDAIVALVGGRVDAPLRMLQAECVAGEAAIDVTDLAMRLGGGAAFRKEVGIERVFRDARASAVMAPTVDDLQDFIGRALCGLPLFD